MRDLLVTQKIKELYCKIYRNTRRSIYNKFLFIAFITLYFVFLLSCSRYNIESVNINVKVNSKVDMRNYHTIAVIDFFDIKGKLGKEYGELLARMVRKQLMENKDFKVLEKKDIELDEEIDPSIIDNKESLINLCNQIGVDAIILGKYEFGQRYYAVPYIVERYSPRTNRYTPEGRTYIQKAYYLKFHAMVIDGKNGEVIYDFAPPVEERTKYPGSSGLPFSSDSDDPANLRAIAGKPVRNFVLSLIPHQKSETRLLVK